MTLSLMSNDAENGSISSTMNLSDAKYTILHIAIETPLRHVFDYLLPESLQKHLIVPGLRVNVPFRKKTKIGVITAITKRDVLPEKPLRQINEVIDEKPILIPNILKLILWACDYYHYSIGECIMSALPVLLRQGMPEKLKIEKIYFITSHGEEALLKQKIRSQQQEMILTTLKQQSMGYTLSQIKALTLKHSSLNGLIKKGWVGIGDITEQPLIDIPLHVTNELALSAEQSSILNVIPPYLNQFKTFLLYGVTGSGKTEIYLQIIHLILKEKKQALVLIPEIALTPQTIKRFQERFNIPIVALHSGLSDRERLNAWIMAKTGRASIIIGTRSAIFTPLLNPGIIIVDEEHDISFKQQEGFRYSARDLAIVRGRLENIPILLGSATPALESLYNANQKRYELLQLTERAAGAILPTFKIIDIRAQKLNHYLFSSQLLAAMDQHLAKGGQVLLFLNRRGYATSLLCHHCGWVAHCHHCDANMVFHQNIQQLHCHHCNAVQKLPSQCPHCNNQEFIPLGAGTERLEQALLNYYSADSIVRIDRDSARPKGALESMFNTIHSGKSRILIGTQMLAKGHHFPDVTLVGILNADAGLYSVDFRATERLAQLITQVAGRAGRAEKQGEVIIQTHNPNHLLLQQLIQFGYIEFAKKALEERQESLLPPFTCQCLLRAEAYNKVQVYVFLNQVKQLAKEFERDTIEILGPVASIMEKKGGYYRAQLLFQAKNKHLLQILLKNLIPKIEKIKNQQKVRWAIDVDPLDTL
ncbi:MAG: Primosomal protein N' [Legionellaceae bacterium]